jgi:hypothetical protein
MSPDVSSPSRQIDAPAGTFRGTMAEASPAASSVLSRRQSVERIVRASS